MMVGRFIRIVLLVLCWALITGPVQANNLSLIINGKAVHLGAPKNSSLNEENWGLGVQYDFNVSQNHWLPFVAVSGFLDSVENPSYYVGGGMMRRFMITQSAARPLYFDAGLIAFMMTRENYKGGDPFPGVLPALSFGTDKLAVNITYIPSVDPKLIPLWFFQLKVSMDIFED